MSCTARYSGASLAALQVPRLTVQARGTKLSAVAPASGIVPYAPPPILLIERERLEASFVDSSIRHVLKADVFLWYEERLDAALKVLAATSFRLILVGAPSLPRVSNRLLVKRLRAVAPRTPILLRLPTIEWRGAMDTPRIYAGVEVAPKQHAEAVVQAVRRVLRPDELLKRPLEI